MKKKSRKNNSAKRKLGKKPKPFYVVYCGSQDVIEDIGDTIEEAKTIKKDSDNCADYLDEPCGPHTIWKFEPTGRIK